MLKKIISNNTGNQGNIDQNVTSRPSAPPNNSGYESTNVHETIQKSASANTQVNHNIMNASKNILSNDCKIKGTIEFDNDLIIDGAIEGEIISSGEGSLVIGENASISGEIKTKSVVVHGNVKGNITVGNRCELKSSSKLEGDIKAASLSIEEGAKFIGSSSVGSMSASKPSSINKNISSPSKSIPSVNK